MKQWFQQFNQREQLYLLLCAAAVALYLLLVGVWRPVTSMRDDMASQNERVAQSLQRVQTLVSELQQLRATGGGQGDVNLNRMINASTSKHSIAPTRIQPSSRGDTQVRFEDVKLENLLRWLHQLETVDDLVIRELSINQGKRGGLVNVSVRVGPG
ncbi:MAG: type II secretion system protein GspM [Gammaproteobacteria bacterium]|nr:type II secretion system protein GspM [Gammaproteobacteria bacterium]